MQYKILTVNTWQHMFPLHAHGIHHKQLYSVEQK